MSMGAPKPEPVLKGNIKRFLGGILLLAVVIGAGYAALYFGKWWILGGAFVLYFILKGSGSSYSSRRGYQRLAAWVEDNSPAKFDGSQPPEEIEQHLNAKVDELKRQGWSDERLSGFRWFIEERMYDKLLK